MWCPRSRVRAEVRGAGMRQRSKKEQGRVGFMHSTVFVLKCWRAQMSGMCVAWPAAMNRVGPRLVVPGDDLADFAEGGKPLQLHNFHGASRLGDPGPAPAPGTGWRWPCLPSLRTGCSYMSIMGRQGCAGNPISAGAKKILGAGSALRHDGGVPKPDSFLIKDSLHSVSRSLGFSDCRVARAGRALHAEELFLWLERGWHAGMEWMARFSGTPG